MPRVTKRYREKKLAPTPRKVLRYRMKRVGDRLLRIAVLPASRQGPRGGRTRVVSELVPRTRRNPSKQRTAPRERIVVYKGHGIRQNEFGYWRIDGQSPGMRTLAAAKAVIDREERAGEEFHHPWRRNPPRDARGRFTRRRRSRR